MLVLSRKVGEKIELGDDVVIQVLRIRGNEMRLGITAPKEVKIRRVEVPKPTPTEPDDATRAA